MKMSFYDDIAQAEKTMTTFQAEVGSAQSTTLHSRRRGRGGDEPEETDGTFILEPLTHRTARDVRGAHLDGSSKGVDIV